MDAVFVDQAQVAFGKGDVLPQDPLAELSLHDVGQLDIVMGVELRPLSLRKMMTAAERLRRRAHGSIDLPGAADVPAQRKDPLLLQKRVGLYLLGGFGILRADKPGVQLVLRGEEELVVFCDLAG